MSVAILAEKADTDLPLDLTIEKEGVGGVTGKSPTVALRKGSTTNSYLDWADNTFKIAGWTTKYASMTEIERGHYQRALNLSVLGSSVKAGDVLLAEYHVNDGAGVIGDAQDVIMVVAQTTDMSVIRKAVTNRQEELPGTPGRIILYDDDGTTKILEQELRDNAGGGIMAAVAVPAKRTANILP